jgi:uncharacterized protein
MRGMIRSRLRATDFYLLTECDRLVYLDYYGDPAQRVPLSRYQVWLVERGVLFERQVLDSIQPEHPPLPAEDVEDAFHLTHNLMQRGVEMIYQGALVDGDLAGMPDLLIRTPGASCWGDYHYRPLDIKSTATPTLGHRLQVMAYIILLEAIQGVRPEGSLLLKVPAGEADADQLYREERIILDDLLFAEHLAQVRALAAGHEPRPFVASICRECGWQGVCRPLAERAQDISLIPGLKRTVWEALHAQGLGTLPALAAAHPEALTRIKGVGVKTAGTLVQQARAQSAGQAIHLQRPDLRRVDPVAFFDVESVPGENITYLMGVLIRCGGATTYEYDLAASFEDEAAMWHSFLARMEAWDGPIYHYSSYERTIIRRLVERYGGADRAEAVLSRMIDLERVLKESTVLPLQSYSLKEVAPWLGFRWGGEVTAAQDSMLEYIHFLADGDPAHLARVLRYNEDDCRATAVIHDWLLNLAEPA